MAEEGCEFEGFSLNRKCLNHIASEVDGKKCYPFPHIP